MNTAPTTDTSVSQAITNYVAKAGKCSWIELYGIFGPETDTEAYRKKFSTILANLVARNQINTNHHGDGLRIKDRYYTRIDEESATQTCAAVTPPPGIDTMTAPVYVPPAITTTRPGALDYRRWDSHGVRC